MHKTQKFQAATTNSIASHQSWALQRFFSISVFLLQLVCAPDWKPLLLEVVIHRPLELGIQVHERVRVLSEDVCETDALGTDLKEMGASVNQMMRLTLSLMSSCCDSQRSH